MDQHGFGLRGYRQPYRHALWKGDLRFAAGRYADGAFSDLLWLLCSLMELLEQHNPCAHSVALLTNHTSAKQAANSTLGCPSRQHEKEACRETVAKIVKGLWSLSEGLRPLSQDVQATVAKQGRKPPHPNWNEHAVFLGPRASATKAGTAVHGPWCRGQPTQTESPTTSGG